MGSFYVLIALGLTLIFGILQVPHFAHGAVMVLGGYISYMLVNQHQVPFFLAMLIAMVITACIGIVLERIAYRPVLHAPPINAFIVALGLLILIENIMTLVYGPDQVMIKTNYNQVVSVGGVSTIQLVLYLLITSFVLVTLLYLFIQYTKIGMAIRAVSQNGEASMLMGVNPNRIRMIVFGIGSALAAAGGAFIGSWFALYPPMGGHMIMKAFVVIILGGLGSFPGAVIGGLLIGFTESFGAWLISSAYKDLFSFALMILLLIFRPQGLFGKR